MYEVNNGVYGSTIEKYTLVKCSLSSVAERE